MDSYNDLWNLVREYCKEHVTDTIYSLWLEPLQLVSFEDNKVVLSASEFKANIVQKKSLRALGRYVNSFAFLRSFLLNRPE